MVEIRLLKPHIHGGKEYIPGATLFLRPDQAERLVALEIAKMVQEARSFTITSDETGAVSAKGGKTVLPDKKKRR